MKFTVLQTNCTSRNKKTKYPKWWLLQCKWRHSYFIYCSHGKHQLDITNRKSFYGCSVTAQYFILSWTASSGVVHVACDCLFITNYTLTMGKQSHLDWNIHEVERAHNKRFETGFAGAPTVSSMNLAKAFCDIFPVLFRHAIVFSVRISCTT